jgi:hypothetical protein
MKTYMIVFGLILTGLISCHSQDMKSGKERKAKIKPTENVTVNRKYDENGNLIEFDSTYTSFYSNMQGDTLQTDSIMKDFSMYFDNHFRGISSYDLPGIDSTSMSQFFRDDFFEHGFFDQDEQMLKMMRAMDSVKNEFFRMYAHSGMSMMHK